MIGEQQVQSLVEENNQRITAELALAQSDLAGLVDHEITQPYAFQASTFASAEVKSLQTYERSNFSAFKQVLDSARKFKRVVSNCERELSICETLLKRVEPALKDSVRKTF